MRKLSITRLLELLEAEYGDPDWWPGDGAFEVAIGAILAQRTAWNNVERSLENLKSMSLLDPGTMSSADPRTLARAIKPSGFYKQKTTYIRAFSRYLLGSYYGDMEKMRLRPLSELRDELLDVRGIGPETADSILLYALGIPSFVVDSYTHRLLERLRLDQEGGYEAVKTRFEASLEGDLRKLALMHALIVVHCKQRCKVRPECLGCPLTSYCPSKRE